LSDITDCAFHGFVATKSRRNKPSLVSETNDSTIHIGTILEAVNGQPTDSMTPLELSRYFTNRDDKVVPIFRLNETVRMDNSELRSDQVSKLHSYDMHKMLPFKNHIKI
jgi:hypothetical protein